MTENVLREDVIGKTARVSSRLVGRSPAMASIREEVLRVADTVSTVLVTGPSGSGKENVARALHEHSNRRDGPFVPVNCGAIPAELAEAELFGADAGAYTGAGEGRPGRIESAQGGTLFLDEVGELPLATQVKLLRVLETRQITRLGATRSRAVDVRIVAATNVHLERAVAEKRFRNDLYWRLAVICIDLPPLRAREGDIPLLVRHFASCLGGEVGVTPDGLRVLEGHAWPGNLRELRNVVERALAHRVPRLDAVTATELIRPRRYSWDAWLDGQKLEGQDDRPQRPGYLRPGHWGRPDVPLPEDGKALKALLLEAERALIEQALEATGGTVAASARILGVKRTTLVEKMKRIGISVGQEPVA